MFRLQDSPKYLAERSRGRSSSEAKYFMSHKLPIIRIQNGINNLKYPEA